MTGEVHGENVPPPEDSKKEDPPRNPPLLDPGDTAPEVLDRLRHVTYRLDLPPAWRSDPRRILVCPVTPK